CAWRVSRYRCRAPRAGSRRRRRSLASTPTRCSRSSASRRRRSPPCAGRTRFDKKASIARAQRGGPAMDDVTKTDKMLARKDGHVGYVIFNNPERHNAVSLDMWAATRRILDGFVNDEEVRVVVLTGAGGKAFVSGADVSKFESERGTLDATRHY